MRAQLSFILSQFTRLTDGETERRIDTFFASRPPCIQCSKVQNNTVLLNIKINPPILSNVCRYNWSTNWQKIHSNKICNLSEKDAKSWGGATF